ncbi:ABC-type sugar transport system, permease component [Sphaerochaeta pleomorpha str. Grapes]|uniref:ABC-type sugar transport system, permease component n=1 Tax=Sphaerochaeta pleomorpha (strain ATCC BAA-1885 / DSM 22778 / Grapes) TaxID=158190 RepID=G8QWD2_SPHPG|nr:carbohydrate ABC transporter permease [Sphaerochaeta pleomorpha]AEV29430.1 ABC-type sugar transport system, permease component [Sphaerochaeta pleomorpha str. Grapes]
MPIIQDSERSRGQGKRIYIGIIVILLVCIPFQVLPHLWMFFGMFKDKLEVMTFPPSLFPRQFFWGNISETFVTFDLWNNIKNTVIICGGTILVQVSISSLCAFGLSKLKIKHSNGLLLFFIGTMMISNQATIIPTFLMMNDWGLINSFWSVILTFSAWGWMVFLFKNFFDTLPEALMDAAKIDGANNLTIFIRIVFPLSLPVFSIAVLNTFNVVYSQFMVPLMLLPAKDKWPLMLQIYTATVSAVPWNQVMVLLTTASLPLIIIYIFCQKYVVEGVVMTGIKG